MSNQIHRRSIPKGPWGLVGVRYGFCMSVDWIGPKPGSLRHLVTCFASLCCESDRFNATTDQVGGGVGPCSILWDAEEPRKLSPTWSVVWVVPAEAITPNKAHPNSTASRTHCFPEATDGGVTGKVGSVKSTASLVSGQRRPVDHLMIDHLMTKMSRSGTWWGGEHG